MEKEEFIQKLLDLGFDIHVVCGQDCGSHTQMLFLNDIRLSSSDEEVFGFRTGGTYAQCQPINKKFSEEDLQEAIKACSRILSGEIKQLRSNLDYFDIREHLRNKRDNSKKQIEINAIIRVLDIIHEDFNDMIRKKNDK